jgi:hypothetical protein
MVCLLEVEAMELLQCMLGGNEIGGEERESWSLIGSFH